MATSFVARSSTQGLDALLRKRERQKFLTGGAAGTPEADALDLAAILGVGAERESRFAQISADRDERERALEQQESQFKRSQQFAKSQAEQQESQFFRSQQFAESEADKAREAAFKGGIAQAITTVAGFGILKYFGLFGSSKSSVQTVTA